MLGSFDGNEEERNENYIEQEKRGGVDTQHREERKGDRRKAQKKNTSKVVTHNSLTFCVLVCVALEVWGYLVK